MAVPASIRAKAVELLTRHRARSGTKLKQRVSHQLFIEGAVGSLPSVAVRLRSRA